MATSVTILAVDTETIARRIAVVDMLRGLALMLLTLGCILVWFHKSVRDQTIQEQHEITLTLTYYLIEVGWLGMVFVLGMSIFFFRKYHFPFEKYNVILTTVVILSLFYFFFNSSLLINGWHNQAWTWALLFFLLLCLGWAAGWQFENHLLLDAEDYAIYMNRKHDFRKVMLVFGQSPLFFFASMLILIKLVAWLTALSAGYSPTELQLISGYKGLPASFGYSLPRIYLISFCVLAMLYPACKFYGSIKASYSYGWLKYL